MTKNAPLLAVGESMKVIEITAIEAAGYKIKQNGTVLGIKNGLPLRPDQTADGYLKVSLIISGRKETYRVHRLVASKYVPHRSGCDEVNHKDGNRQNNAAENLEWVSRSENNFHKSHGYWDGRELLRQRCCELLASGYSMSSVANNLGVSASTVHRWNETVKPSRR